MLFFNRTFHQDAGWTQNNVNALPHLLTLTTHFIYFKYSKIQCIASVLLYVTRYTTSYVFSSLAPEGRALTLWGQTLLWFFKSPMHC